ncbi:hypothetical protein CFIMG_005867RA [Ceratocystis fimbriata CBS 114723]|uniref:DUF6536 domain-containing protein n=1 Tax=Ceratocystis fimbriata CBS 114723 TaxID=1035309 RepID=A0A2C5WX61_9PEZI|nr:hypothetical protein CFIMG_005867RA [Ceratocystis fimbriata CBS 114723]
MRDLQNPSPLAIIANHIGFSLNSLQPIPNSQPKMNRISRHSFQWPFRDSTHFHSNSNSATSNHTALTALSNDNTTIRSGFWARQATWISRRHQHSNSAASDANIVPDYVVNYMRGETPESLAIKREMRRGPQAIRIHRQSRGFQSRSADFFTPQDSDGFSDTASDTAFRGMEKDVQCLGWSSGWRATLLLNLGVTFTILMLLVAVFIAVITRTNSLTKRDALFTGACENVENIGYGLHVVTSAMTIAILAIGNYTFQVLSSPTRAEVVAAHEKKWWLDIGIPSVRNLGYISSGRVVIIVSLLLSVFTAQVLYKSILFVAHSSAGYGMALVSESYLSGASFQENSFNNNAGGLPLDYLLSLQQTTSEFTKLSTADCARDFASKIISSFGVLLLVTTQEDSAKGSLLQTAINGTLLSDFADTITDSKIVTNGYNVDYCMALPSQLEKTCSIKEGHWHQVGEKLWAPQEHLWLMAPSMMRWVIWVLSLFVPAILAAVSITLGIVDDPFKTLSNFAMPTDSQFHIFKAGSSDSSIALLSGLPHLFPAILYMVTDALVSTYFVSHEMSQYASSNWPKHLRLSSGVLRGNQTSSLYITIPFKWSWAIITIFIGLSFVVSQSIFMISIKYLPSPLTSDQTLHETPGIGMSGIGMVLFIAILGVLLFLIVGLGMRRADPFPMSKASTFSGNPMVLRGGTCSAVISSRCHTLGRSDISSEALVWGVVQEGDGAGIPGHAAFSYKEVGALQAGRAYA